MEYEQDFKIVRGGSEQHQVIGKLLQLPKTKPFKTLFTCWNFFFALGKASEELTFLFHCGYESPGGVQIVGGDS